VGGECKIPPPNARLERLICSGLRQDNDLEHYSQELRLLVENMDAEHIDQKTRTLKALANETRLKMVHLLMNREMCVCELMVALRLTQPTASHHLNILENMRIIQGRKEGRWVFYSIAEAPMIKYLFDFLEIPAAQ
jgi:DNA-binding transcriptional ArsR family regulator